MTAIERYSFGKSESRIMLGRGFRRATRVAQRQAERAQRDLSAAEAYPDVVAQETISGLNELRCLAAPATPNGSMSIKRLLDEMALPEYADGFTLSPTTDPGGRFVSPDDRHHCVALPGANLPLAWATQPTQANSAEPVPQQAARLFRAWVRFMAPVFGTGIAWVGGYRPDVKKFDTEATLVFVPDCRRHAHSAAKTWRQHSYWTIKNDHEHGGVETRIGRKPCGSVFVAFLESS